MESQAGRQGESLAGVASAIGFVMICVYLLAIAIQGSGIDRRVLFVTAFLAMAVVLAGAGMLWLERDHRVAQVTLYAATAAYGVLGFLAILSIGIPLLIAAALAYTAAGAPRIGRGALGVALIVPIAVLVVGLIATS